MKKLVFCFPLFFAFVACTLSAKQEANVNLALSKYLQARNQCQLATMVAFTYPELVHEYKSMGDEVFQKAFDCSSNVEELRDPNLKTVNKSGKDIHVKYLLKSINKEMNSETEFGLVAISENKGETWYFLAESDYADSSKCKNLVRLY